MAIGAGFVDGLGYGGNTKAAIIRIGLKEMVCAATLARPASTFPRAADHRAPIVPPRQKKFCNMFYDGIDDDTFLESCGVADLITTCFGGRNRKCAEAFAKHGTQPREKNRPPIRPRYEAAAEPFKARIDVTHPKATPQRVGNRSRPLGLAGRLAEKDVPSPPPGKKKSLDEIEAELLGGQKLQGTLTAKEVNHVLKMKGLEHEFPFFTAVYKISYEDTPLEAITTTPY